MTVHRKNLHICLPACTGFDKCVTTSRSWISLKLPVPDPVPVPAPDIYESGDVSVWCEGPLSGYEVDLGNWVAIFGRLG